MVGDLLDKAKLTQLFAQYRVSAVMHFAGVSLVAESLVDPRRRSSEGFASEESLQILLARKISNQLENELHDASGEGRSATMLLQSSFVSCEKWAHQTWCCLP